MPKYIAIQTFTDGQAPVESAFFLPPWPELDPERAAEIKASTEEYLRVFNQQDVTVTFLVELDNGSRVEFFLEPTPAKRIFHHDATPCTTRLDDHGNCPQCNLRPTIQNLSWFPYCPACDCPLNANNLKCPVCRQTFKDHSTGR